MTVQISNMQFEVHPGGSCNHQMERGLFAAWRAQTEICNNPPPPQLCWSLLTRDTSLTLTSWESNGLQFHFFSCIYICTHGFYSRFHRHSAPLYRMQKHPETSCFTLATDLQLHPNLLPGDSWCFGSCREQITAFSERTAGNHQSTNTIT